MIHPKNKIQTLKVLVFWGKKNPKPETILNFLKMWNMRSKVFFKSDNQPTLIVLSIEI
jgi:hypothetical protein